MNGFAAATSGSNYGVRGASNSPNGVGVIGVVQAFEQLGKQGMSTAQAASAAAPQEVMAAIAEALVATAVGLAVAIPAVAAYNFYQRHTRAVLGNTDALSNVLLAHLSGLDNGNGNGKKADEDH